MAKKRNTKVTTKKKAVKKKRPSVRRKKTVRASGNEAFSIQSPLRTYQHLEDEIEKAWAELRKNVKKRDPVAIQKGRDDLLFLLGECDYMAQECTRCIENT